MSRVFFDTSALVPVVTEQLSNHAAAHARFVRELKGAARPCCGTHTLAECYATLTALLLPRRISGPEAARLIEANFSNRLEIVDLSQENYQAAIRLCADLGRMSGQIYDALHLLGRTQKRMPPPLHLQFKASLRTRRWTHTSFRTITIHEIH